MVAGYLWLKGVYNLKMTADFFIIILQVVVALIGAYIVYYSRKKGENQADKEDLNEITEIVEEVRQKYAEETEILKAELHLLTSKKNLLFSEEKEAIIQYFAQLDRWIWDGLNVRIAEYNHNNYQDLSDRLIRMRDDQNQTNVAFGKLQLLCNDEALIKIGHEANMKTLELHHFKEGLIKRLIGVLSWEKILIDQVTAKDFDFSKLPLELKDFYKSQAAEREGQKEAIVAEFLEKNKGYFNPAVEFRNKFKTNGKIYLNK